MGQEGWLIRLFGRFQTVRALFHVRRPVLATEGPVASTADHEGHANPVGFFTDITILCSL
jgi:hypothetical protein